MAQSTIIANNFDLAIIGAGPTGLFAAFQAGMLGMNAAIIDILPHTGGQCMALYPEKPIYDIPALPEVSAADLIKNLEAQAAPFKPQYFLNQSVEGLVKNEEGVQITTSKGITINAKAVVIAAGAGAFGPNRPPLENLGQFENTSIFYSVTNKDKFKDSNIAIAGGGDSALDWANVLAPIARKIYVIHRRNTFRGMENSLSNLQTFIEAGKVEIVTPYQLHALEGENGKLSTLSLIDLDQQIRILEVDFLLPFFGLRMELGSIANWGLNLDRSHITVDASTMETNVARVFAIGDICYYPGKLKLILTGFAEAALAMHTAYKYVFPNKALHFEYSTTKGIRA